ncbi:radical SAM protein with 4Fe4S-binding SPASM domain [Ruminiclostridium sufflavum DSM 19573]|uniref:Radical SAM protein with 4Fe4S-binding SPASM domain n=1 Tax=Ruminiclostridium sufflavum DSM 19573 TaxID=1121337 RepID=A0A318XMQ8_9FIRM|nr:radical SAM/SPASM domain-containing protein [Ruminiclostridium sufflavum]PYG89142.1 radical SAM protein with 4Fe4S-binding SPASM domain [Ruminiclostridium sufflavum DSM 19573]
MKKYKKAYIEITNICNLKCDFCPSTKRQLKHMNKKEFIHVISQVKLHTEYIYFHLMGEPLLNPELGSFLAISFDAGIKVNITTNGILLNKQKAILLNSPALRKVSISLHSFEANKSAAKIEEYIIDVIDFTKEAWNRGIICELRLWNGESEGIKASNTLNTDILEMLEYGFKPDFCLHSAIEQGNSVKLRDRLFLQFAQKFEWPDIELDSFKEAVFCYGLRDQFGILVDGTVVPCCMDSEGSIPLGNVFDKPLEEILNSGRAKRIYEGFTGRTAVEELCKRCGYSKRHKR